MDQTIRQQIEECDNKIADLEKEKITLTRKGIKEGGFEELCTKCNDRISPIVIKGKEKGIGICGHCWIKMIAEPLKPQQIDLRIPPFAVFVTQFPEDCELVVEVSAKGGPLVEWYALCFDKFKNERLIPTGIVLSWRKRTMPEASKNNSK